MAAKILILLMLISTPLGSKANTWLKTNCKKQQDHFFCKDIPYKNRGDHFLKLDIYLPLHFTTKTRPVLWIHGGCFYMGNKEDEKQSALRLAKAGFAVFVVEYTLAHTLPYPAAYEDVRDAVLWIKNKAVDQIHIDRKWIAAAGASAGGTLASYLGTRALPGKHIAQVNAVVDLFGRTDFTLPPSPASEDCPSIFAGRKIVTKRDEYATMSVEPQSSTQFASFFIAHSQNDPMVEVTHSYSLFKKLMAAGGKNSEIELVIVPGHFHGFTKKSDRQVWHRLIQFLKAH